MCVASLPVTDKAGYKLSVTVGAVLVTFLTADANCLAKVVPGRQGYSPSLRARGVGDMVPSGSRGLSSLSISLGLLNRSAT